MKQLFLCAMIVSFFACKDQQTPESIIENTLAESTANFFDPVEVAGKDYFVDDQHSYIGFRIKYFGFSPVRGRFNSFDGSVFYDPESVSQTQMILYIDVNSINTGNERRDKDLITGEGWFNETQHPIISFRSTRTDVNTDGSFLLIGDFTMNGVTQEISVPFEKPTEISRDFAANEQIDYSGKLVLNRKDFGVNGGEFWDTVLENGLTQLSNEVEIELDIHTRRADYLKRFEDLEPDNIRKTIIDSFQLKGMNGGMAAMLKLQEDPRLTSGAIATIGNTLMATESYDEAISVFEFGAQQFPEKTTFPNKLGIASLHKKDKEKAMAYFRSALKVEPTNSTAAGYLNLLDR